MILKTEHLINSNWTLHLHTVTDMQDEFGETFHLLKFNDDIRYIGENSAWKVLYDMQPRHGSELAGDDGFLMWTLFRFQTYDEFALMAIRFVYECGLKHFLPVDALGISDKAMIFENVVFFKFDSPESGMLAKLIEPELRTISFEEYRRLLGDVRHDPIGVAPTPHGGV